MPSGYHHLTHEERCQIYALRKSGLSDLAIARQIGRDRTTVRREIRRNGGGRGYRHLQAQGKASARRSAASSVARKMTPERWTTVEDRLAEGWSPEQIAGRFRKEGIPMAGREWIYQHVRADRKAGGRLFLFLRRRGRKPNWKGGRHSGRGRIPDRTDISERPEIVEAKERIGDWEADTIIGKGHSGVSLATRERGWRAEMRAGRRTARFFRGLGGGRRPRWAPRCSRCCCRSPPWSARSLRAPELDHGQRQGVRGARPGGEGAPRRSRGRVPLRHAVPLVGAGPERAHERPGAGVFCQLQGHGLPADHRRGGEGRPGPAERASEEGRSAARPRPRRSGSSRGLPDRSRPGPSCGGTGPARERGVCGPPTSVGLRPPFARRAAAAPWARLAPSGGPAQRRLRCVSTGLQPPRRPDRVGCPGVGGFAERGVRQEAMPPSTFDTRAAPDSPRGAEMAGRSRIAKTGRKVEVGQSSLAQP